MSTGFIDLKVTVSDYARAANAIKIANNGKTYNGIFQRTITDILDKSTRYARDIVDVDTGHLYGALTWKYDSHLMSGMLFVSDRTAWNSSTNVRREPQKYAVYEERRGGKHAFMRRTMTEKTEKISLIGLHAKVETFSWP